MSPAEALAVFALEVGRAWTDSGAPGPVPRVTVAELTCLVQAETVPGEIRLGVCTAAQAARGGRYRSRPWLRCIARHEVAHRVLGHAPRDPRELPGLEAEVAAFMRTRWREPWPNCEGRHP